MAKKKRQNKQSKMAEYVNWLPLCLSCAYFALLIGLMGTSYLKSPATGASVILPFALIIVAYALGLWTFYPRTEKPDFTSKNSKTVAKKRSSTPINKFDAGGEETMIE